MAHEAWAQERAQEFIEETRHGVVVHWEKAREPGYSYEVWNALVDLLVEKGVLSHDPDGSYCVTNACNALVSPYRADTGVYYFFTSARHAKDWCERHCYEQGAPYTITRQNVKATVTPHAKAEQSLRPIRQAQGRQSSGQA